MLDIKAVLPGKKMLDKKAFSNVPIPGPLILFIECLKHL